MLKNGHYYYDVREMLLRHTDCVLFFSVGVRRAGKTYSSTDRAGTIAVEKGKGFIWLRTLESEVELTANDSWYKQLKEKYPDVDFKMKRYHKIKTLFINDVPMGYFLSVRQWERIKGVKFENIEAIYYDEFLSKTLRREKNFDPVIAFQGLVHTVNERRSGKDSVKAILMANQVTYNNAFFKTFGISIPYGYKGVYKDKNIGIACEVVYDEAFAEEQKNTSWGKIFMTNEYGAHAIENDSMMYSDAYIINKKPANLHCMCALRYFDSYIYIYDDLDENIYVEESKTKPEPRVRQLAMRFYDAEKYEVPLIDKYSGGVYARIINKAISDNKIKYLSRDAKEILLMHLV